MVVVIVRSMLSTDATISAYGSPQPPLAQPKNLSESLRPAIPRFLRKETSSIPSTLLLSLPLYLYNFALIPFFFSLFYCWVFSFLFVVRSTKYSLFSGVQNIGGEPPEPFS